MQPAGSVIPSSVRTVPVSVVIPTHNRPERLAATLQKIFRCDPLPAELLIFFDGQPDATDSIPADAPILIKTYHSDTPNGPGGARNVLIKNTSCDIVCSFDDDSYPRDLDFFEHIPQVFDSLPNAGAVMASIRLPGQEDGPQAPVAIQCRSFSGSGSAFRRSAILETDGYIPLPLAYGMEETDMSLQLWAAGFNVYQTDWLRVRHDSTPSPAQRKRIAIATVKNAALFPYLRYPLVLAPVALYQWLRALGYGATILSFGELLQTVGEIPRYLKDNKEFIHRFSPRDVLRYISRSFRSRQHQQIVARDKTTPSV
jgi:glycosyltransferase involved in cell wall biosynthesis